MSIWGKQGEDSSEAILSFICCYRIGGISIKIFLAKLMLQLALDKESRKKLLAIVGAVILVVFLILSMLVYILTSPFSFLTKFFLSGEESSAMDEFKNLHNQEVIVIADSLNWQGGKYPMPMFGEITSEYGHRNHPITGNYEMHTGIDLASGGQANIVSIADGQVSNIGIDPDGYGNYVLLKHEAEEDGVFFSFYAHLAEVLVLPDQEVFQGSIIGLEGGGPEDLFPGKSTGRHLHFEIRITESSSTHVDPYSYLFEPPEEEEEDDSDEDATAETDEIEDENEIDDKPIEGIIIRRD